MAPREQLPKADCMAKRSRTGALIRVEATLSELVSRKNTPVRVETLQIPIPRLRHAQEFHPLFVAGRAHHPPSVLSLYAGVNTPWRPN